MLHQVYLGVYQNNNATLRGLTVVSGEDCSADKGVWPPSFDPNSGYDSFVCFQVPVTAARKYAVQLSAYDMSGSARNVLVSVTSAGAFVHGQAWVSRGRGVSRGGCTGRYPGVPVVS